MQETSPRPKRALATFGILTGLALGALDATIVGPAMPKIVATLEGVELYFLVTAIFMVTSTSTTPVWGRLLDLYGRRMFYIVGVIVFIGGSALCGAAQSMTQLVVYRGVQGLGAGALLPASFTMVADLYPLE
ncbi:MAG: MFS transporter, partial [Planctomycetes bacterium]|nr:MFS transporter [Planctomycetota bacterium]